MDLGLVSIGAGTGAGTDASGASGVGMIPAVRRRYGTEEKLRLVSETFKAGETVTTVSHRHGVCSSLLHRWRRAARGEVPSQRRPTPRLLPVQITPVEAPVTAVPAPARPAVPGSPPASAELVLRNGRVLRFEVSADPTAIARLAAALEA